MARLPFAAAAGFVITIALLCFDSVTAFHIKSKTASGDGCPSEYWVNATASSSGELRIQFPDLGPQVTSDQAQSSAAKSCRVILELESDPISLRASFYLKSVAHEAEFHSSSLSDWETVFATNVQLGENTYNVSRHCNYLDT